MFIELTGLFDSSDVDYEGMGIEVTDVDPIKTLINLNNVTEINEANDDKTTIGFVDGNRFLFADTYKEVKQKVENAVIKSRI